jgi:hypothetical protein
MNEKWIEQIRRNLETRSTEELLQIWEKNDRNEWTDEAFIVIQRILEARGENPSPQGLPSSEDQVTQGKAAHADQRQRPGCVTAFAILVVIGAIFSVLNQFIPVISGSAWDEGNIIGAVVALSLAGLSIAVAVGLWRLKNWARIATIVLLGLNMLILVALLASGFYPAVIGILVNGYCIYWFAANKQYFELAVED